jgi:hypothetical protein
VTIARSIRVPERPIAPAKFELSLELIPFINRVLVKRVEPGEWSLVQAEREVEALRVIVATNVSNG